MTSGIQQLRHWRYPVAALAVAVTMLLALPLRDHIDVANIDVLFLLAVFLVAIVLGRGPAVLAAFLGVALFDFFFVPPYLSFAVADAQYLITFAVMLSVGLITSHLAARLAEETAIAHAREAETRMLYELASRLGVATDLPTLRNRLREFMAELDLEAEVAMIANPDADTDKLQLDSLGERPLSTMEIGFARAACARRGPLEADALAGMGMAILFVPLLTTGGVLGVLAISPRTRDIDRLREQRPLIEAAASLAATIVERLGYADAAHRSEMEAASERLRNTILSSLSHDLRTPLTGIVGLADAIAQHRPPLPDEVAEAAAALRDQAHAMHRLLSNLLEMARLQSGRITVNKAWQPIDEIVGTSTRLLAELLAGHSLLVDVPPDLPLIEFDAVLMERVLCNLLENAAKYSPPGSQIRLSADSDGSRLRVRIENQGDGFPAERINRIFDAFVRGRDEGTVVGTGLGLAICKAIVAVHGGSIAAENTATGARIEFTLPLGSPPGLSEEPAP